MDARGTRLTDDLVQPVQLSTARFDLDAQVQATTDLARTRGLEIELVSVVRDSFVASVSREDTRLRVDDSPIGSEVSKGT